MTKFIFVTGGVVSGLGKGITAAALGRLLKQRGLKVAAQKFDPYMNVDPGMMSPFQHGEVFVTDDGAETDLDLGHYERFIDENLTKFSSLTSGKVYWNVLEGERSGYYSGNTVQVIPHVTEFIKNCVYSAVTKSQADVLITEIGGTTGDIEGEPFLEAIRQISLEKGTENCLYVHVALVPYLKGAGEHKSKPTQHSVRELRARGIYPNIIVARSDQPLSNEVKEKIAFFCNVKPDCVIENMTLSSLYEAPLMLRRNGFDNVACRELGLETPVSDLSEWQRMVQKIAARKKEIRIALIGKYVRFQDAYLSIIESLNHAGFETAANVMIRWIDSEELNEGNIEEQLQGIEGLIIPGDFDDQGGIEGKIAACRFAREKNIPFLGISHGMHVAVIEFARHICGLDQAHSIEFAKLTPYPVINIVSGQTEKQGMRLGAHLCNLVQGTRLHKLYGYEEISERHRHRLGLNNDYRNILETHGMVMSGTSSAQFVEAIELPEHPFFIGVQYHPEFKSRPNRPHVLFLGLLHSALTHPTT